MLGLWILTTSIFVQIVASVAAIRLAFVTRIRSWFLIAFALLLMALRRSNTLNHFLEENRLDRIDAVSETIALLISVLLLTAVLCIGPLFKKFKEERDISQESFKILFKSFPLGIAVCKVVLDEEERATDYELVMVNAAFGQLFAEELEDSAAPRLKGSDLSSRVPFLEEFAEVDDSSEPLRKEVCFGERERFFKMVAYSLGDGSFALVYEDCSDRKRAELDLKDLNRKLEEAQTLGKSGWWEYDVVNDRLNWPEATYGIFEIDPNERMDYESFKNCVDRKYREYHDEQMRTLFESGEAEFEYPILTGSGKERWIWGRGEADFGEDGKPLRLFGTFQDITLGKEAERLRDDLDRVVHHDLRSPLSTVFTITDLLRAKCVDEESLELISAIRGSTQRMIRQVNMSLDLFRIEDGRYEVMKSPVGISDLLDEVLSDLRQASEAQGVVVRVEDVTREDTASVFAVEGESSLCYSIFFNLIKNAIEASNRGGNVFVRFSKAEDDAIVCIQNSIPIPLSLRSQLFTKYKTSSKKSGIGLGAYAARLMVEIQGGNIELESNENQGTLIRVSLPLVHEDTSLPPGLPDSLA